MPIRLTIVDDHPLVLSGLEGLFQSIPQIEVINTFSSGEDLLEGLKQEQPDVLLLDLQMPGLSGPNLVDVIRRDYEAIRILMLTGTGTTAHAQYMIKRGCLGFLLKSTTDKDVLVDAIEKVYRGKIFLDQAIKDDMISNMLKEDEEESSITAITSREKEVLKLLVTGLTSQEIADKLVLSIRTIHTHRHSLLQKLNVNNTPSLIKVATELGLIDDVK